MTPPAREFPSPSGFFTRLAMAVAFAAALGSALTLQAQEKTADIDDDTPVAEAPAGPAPRSIADIIGVLDQYKPDPARVAASRAKLAEAVPQTEDRATLFRYYFQRGLAARQLGDDGGAIVELRKAREFMQPGEREAIAMMFQLANAEFISGNALNTLKVLQERLAMIPKNAAGQVIPHEAYSALASAAFGDFDSARRSLVNAEETFKRASRSPNFPLYRHNWASSLENTRGEVSLAEGKLVEAVAAYRKALAELDADAPDRIERTRRGMPQANEVGNVLTKGLINRRLANTLARLGRSNEAENHVRTALKISLERSGRYTTRTALDLQIFAIILLEQGRFAEGALMARQAVLSIEGSGAPLHSFAAISARRALGAALVTEGKWQEALEAFDAMRKNAETEPELAKNLARGDLDWAHALLKVNKAADARAMLQNMQASAIKTFGENDARTAQVRGFHAIALDKSGARAEALAEYARAVPVLIEQARNESGSVRQLRRLTFVIESYIDALSRTRRAGQSVPGLDAVAESFRLADIARGSDVQRALSASAARSNISDPALADLARREQDSQRRISSLSEILRSLLAAPPDQQLPAVIAQMRKDIDALTQERLALKTEIQKRFPDYAELVDPRPVTTTAVQSALRAGETLISIYLAEDTAFVWAVPKAGNPVLASVPLAARQVAKTVEHLRKALDAQVAGIDDIPAFDVASAARLYEDLLKPVESAWKGSSKHLLIAPHGVLGQLPFGLLPTSNAAIAKDAIPFTEYRKVPWLIREVALTQLPSVTALTTLRRTPQPRGERRMYLGIGDPFFSKEQAVQVATSATTTAPTAATTTRGAPVRLRSAPKTAGVSSAELGLLPRLPDTADELTEIAKTLGADPKRDLMLRKDANEKAVTSMNLADRRIIHFATHGLIPGELNGLSQPALALTAPDVAGIDGDGLLTMDKILALKLNADWVVLSACNTASGDGAGSEAVSGLGRAFFYAGARSLLVSNWPVDSLASRVMMADLFKRYAAGAPTAKAESLQSAMISLIDGPGYIAPDTGKPAYSYAHPLFWAPFVLVGD